MKYLKVSEAAPNTIITVDSNAYGFIRTADIMLKKNGGEYMSGVLYDGTKDIEFKAWELTHALAAVLAAGNCIAITKGKVTTYKDKLQVVIDEADEMNPLQLESSDIVPSSPLSEEDLDAKFYELLALLDEPMRDLVMDITAEYPNLRIIAGGKSMHHAYKRGLWEHSVYVAEMAKNMCQSQPYKDVDVSLVITGALLHDIGKLKEFETNKYGLVEDYTRNGGLLGHIFMGAVSIMAKVKKHIKNADRANHLMHIMLSHHGSPEQGAVKAPATIEAFIVSQADMTDAVINAMNNDIKNAQDGKAYCKFLQRYIQVT